MTEEQEHYLRELTILEKQARMRRIDRRWRIAMAFIILPLLGLSVTSFYGFLPYLESKTEYKNVAYTLDDDRDTYELLIGDGKIAISTHKATFIYLPNIDTENIAVVGKFVAKFTGYTEYHITNFYINAGYKGEQK